jgi:hypothetical protein
MDLSTVPVAERAAIRGAFPAYRGLVKALGYGKAQARADYQRLVHLQVVEEGWFGDELYGKRALARAAFWQSVADAQARTQAGV